MPHKFSPKWSLSKTSIATSKISHFRIRIFFAKLIVIYTCVILIITQSKLQVSYHRSRNNSENFNYDYDLLKSLPKHEMPEVVSNKWIVLTTVNYPTKDVQYLASLPDWNLVVVADLKTPKNWSLDNVHFLSIEIQNDMSRSLRLVRRLPYKSYTRKMIGYLYAISQGAEWIYDTDDDNRPIHRGLNSFDFVDEHSGIRFERNKADPLISRLFNPYLHFGRTKMWPRGFPLEYYKLHTHTDDDFRLCERMKRAAVQQGLVDMDPDVDAIFRLLNAYSNIPPSEHFNVHAPPVILGQNMYSPWNSQNTLFHKNAFFTMFLPTTVTFRTTDIWRSFFAQKLLHLIDEYVSFYPVNAVQIRNAHNYIKDFEDETDVYLKSGAMIKFLDQWKCNQSSIESCMIELAEQFGNLSFWKVDDINLIKDWNHDLRTIGYKFPNLSEPAKYDKHEFGYEKDSNCRRMFLQLFNDKPIDSNKPAEVRALKKMQYFDDLRKFCNEAGYHESHHEITSHISLAKMHAKMPQLNNLLDTALIIVSNYPMSLKYGLSLLQRLYTPYFAAVIFCGSWYPKLQHFSDSDSPPLEYPFNYIHITPQEMNKGYNGEICMIKAYQLRLRNIKGYFAVVDDAVLNFWQPINLDMVFHQWGTKNAEYGRGYWWPKSVGQAAMENTIKMVKDERNCNKICQKTIEEYQQRLLKRKIISENETVFTEMQKFENWTVSDVYYIPTHEMPFFTNLIKIFYRNSLFIEIALMKYLRAASHQIAKNGPKLGPFPEDERKMSLFYYFNENAAFIHAIKLSKVIGSMEHRYAYCDFVIKPYHKVLFLNEKFTSGIEETIY